MKDHMIPGHELESNFPRRDRLLGAVAQWQLRLCFFRQITVCMRSGHFFRTTQLPNLQTGRSNLVQSVPSLIQSFFNVRYKTGGL